MRKINKVARIVGVVTVGGAAAASALALTPGTFGGFTSTTTNPGNSVQSGTLTMTNEKDGVAVATRANMQPGDSATGSVTITNNGSLPADLALAISNTSATTLPSDDVNLLIKDGETAVYNGTVANHAPIPLGDTWIAGEFHTYDVTVTIPLEAGNEAQGKTASFTLDWNGAQH